DPPSLPTRRSPDLGPDAAAGTASTSASAGGATASVAAGPGGASPSGRCCHHAASARKPTASASSTACQARREKVTKYTRPPLFSPRTAAFIVLAPFR